MINHISRHFPNLSPTQLDQFEAMMRLYPDWNAKINVISRKDIDNLEINHLLHSLAIAKFIRFTPGSRVLDFGTGGGLPGLPLAVMMPDVHFHLMDRTGKKITVAREIAKACGLKQNIGTHTLRKTFGYFHYQSNHDIVFLQRLFGHSSALITMRYIGIADEEEKKAYHAVSIDLLETLEQK